MKRFTWYEPRVFETPEGPRFRGYVRSQFLPAHPEERVRQSVLRTLVDHYGYPRSSLLAEEPVARGTKNRGRADILVKLPKRLEPAGEIDVMAPAEAETNSIGYARRVEWLAKRLAGSGVSP